MDLNGLVYAHEFRLSIEGIVLDSPLKSLSSSIENFVFQNIANFDFLGRLASGYVQKWIRDKIGVDITTSQNINLVRKLSNFAVFICSKNDETVLYNDSIELFKAYGSTTQSESKKVVHIECKHKEKRPPLEMGQALRLILNDPGRRKRRYLFKLAADRPSGINLSMYESRRSEVSTQDSSRFFFGHDFKPNLVAENKLQRDGKVGQGIQQTMPARPPQANAFLKSGPPVPLLKDSPPSLFGKSDPQIVQTLPPRTVNPLMSKYGLNGLQSSQGSDGFSRQQPKPPAPLPGLPRSDMFKKSPTSPVFIPANVLQFDKKRHPNDEEVQTARDKPVGGIGGVNTDSFLSDATGRGTQGKPEAVYPHTVHKMRDHSSNIQRQNGGEGPKPVGRFSEQQSAAIVHFNHSSHTRLPPTRTEAEKRNPSALPAKDYNNLYVRQPPTPTNHGSLVNPFHDSSPPKPLHRAPSLPQPGPIPPPTSSLGPQGDNFRPSSHQSDHQMYGKKPTPPSNYFDNMSDAHFPEGQGKLAPTQPPQTPKEHPGPSGFINAYESYSKQSKQLQMDSQVTYLNQKRPEAPGVAQRLQNLPPQKPNGGSTPRGAPQIFAFPVPQRLSTQNQINAIQHIQQLQSKMSEHQIRDPQSSRGSSNFGSAVHPSRSGIKTPPAVLNGMTRYKTQSFNGVESAGLHKGSFNSEYQR
jgi:hypothetical protein